MCRPTRRGVEVIIRGVQGPRRRRRSRGAENRGGGGHLARGSPAGSAVDCLAARVGACTEASVQRRRLFALCLAHALEPDREDERRWKPCRRVGDRVVQRRGCGAGRRSSAVEAARHELAEATGGGWSSAAPMSVSTSAEAKTIDHVTVYERVRGTIPSVGHAAAAAAVATRQVRCLTLLAPKRSTATCGFASPPLFVAERFSAPRRPPRRPSTPVSARATLRGPARGPIQLHHGVVRHHDAVAAMRVLLASEWAVPGEVRTTCRRSPSPSRGAHSCGVCRGASSSPAARPAAGTRRGPTTSACRRRSPPCSGGRRADRGTAARR